MQAHIAKFAPGKYNELFVRVRVYGKSYFVRLGDTMVPLEFVTKLVSGEEAASNALTATPIGLKSTYLDMPPSAVMKMKKELLEHRQQMELIQNKLDNKEHEYALLISYDLWACFLFCQLPVELKC
jgi:hypothetical protein